MGEVERRPFIRAALAAFPLALFGQSVKTSVKIAAGEDRFGQHRTIGVSSTDFKVSSQDSSGGLFVMEHTNTKKGGPPRHLHHNEDEWFYAIQGEYIVEVGSDRVRLKSGDSILAPREVPHSFAFVGSTPGKLLIGFTPGKNMEEFFRNRPSSTAYRNDAELYRAYGMELLGPPIPVE
jgi:mannose-6-phosphate isomerase-like protein (cupin superfamily)